MKKIFLILTMLCAMAQAETYKVYSPFGVGSSPDILVRKLLDTAQTKSQDIFIVINKPGAEGAIAYRHFLEETSPKILATTTSLILDPKLDVQDQTKSLIFYYKLGFYLIAPIDSKLNTISDIKGKLNVGSIIKNADMMLTSLVKDDNVIIIRYNSDADVINGLLRKELDLGNISDGSIIYKANKEKFKIITNYDMVNISPGGGFVVSKDMPRLELMRLNGMFNESFQDEEFRKWLFDRLGKTPIGGKPEVLDKVIHNIKVFQEKY